MLVIAPLCLKTLSCKLMPYYTDLALCYCPTFKTSHAKFVLMQNYFWIQSRLSIHMTYKHLQPGIFMYIWGKTWVSVSSVKSPFQCCEVAKALHIEQPNRETQRIKQSVNNWSSCCKPEALITLPPGVQSLMTCKKLWNSDLSLYD